MNYQIRSENLFRAERLHEICGACFNESVITDVREPRYCREYAGQGSFMLSEDLFFTVPYKCASRYMNQLAFALMEIPKETIEWVDF